MTVAQFKALRQEVGLTQADVANAMGLTPRTIAAWEGAKDNKDLSRLEGRAMRELCMDDLLKKPLLAMADEAHRHIPSELSCLWVVVEDHCRVLAGTIRNQLEAHVENIECRYPLDSLSLTTVPLRSGELINLGGDGILEHPHKKHKGGRGSFYLKQGICHSLLHLPVFAESRRGPMPIILLQMQNRLNSDGEVIEPRDKRPVYTLEETHLAGTLALSFRARLWDKLWMLGLVATREAPPDPLADGPVETTEQVDEPPPNS